MNWRLKLKLLNKIHKDIVIKIDIDTMITNYCCIHTIFFVLNYVIDITIE